MTGGGLPGKIPSMIPDNVTAEFNVGAWIVPAIFQLIQDVGHVAPEEMHRVFNMGLGMVAVTDQESVATILDTIPDAQVIGSIVPMTDENQVRLIY